MSNCNIFGLGMLVAMPIKMGRNSSTGGCTSYFCLVFNNGSDILGFALLFVGAHMHAGAHRGLELGLHPLELELQRLRATIQVLRTEPWSSVRTGPSYLSSP